jgi:hypothetical protein
VCCAVVMSHGSVTKPELRGGMTHKDTTMDPTEQQATQPFHFMLHFMSQRTFFGFGSWRYNVLEECFWLYFCGVLCHAVLMSHGSVTKPESQGRHDTQNTTMDPTEQLAGCCCCYCPALNKLHRTPETHAPVLYNTVCLGACLSILGAFVPICTLLSRVAMVYSVL